jgi:hypothetical protein
MAIGMSPATRLIFVEDVVCGVVVWHPAFRYGTVQYEMVNEAVVSRVYSTTL